LFFPADDVMNDIFRKGMKYKKNIKIDNKVKNIMNNMFNKETIHKKELNKLLDNSPKEKEKLEKTMEDMYKLGSEKYDEYKGLFKECAKICLENEDCCNSFKPYINSDTLVEYKTTFFYY